MFSLPETQNLLLEKLDVLFEMATYVAWFGRFRINASCVARAFQKRAQDQGNSEVEITTGGGRAILA